MSVRVRIPTPLRPLVGGRAQVTTSGATVAEVIGALAAEAPALRAQLLSDDGRLRSFVNLYLNGEDVRSRSRTRSRAARACASRSRPRTTWKPRRRPTRAA